MGKCDFFVKEIVGMLASNFGKQDTAAEYLELANRTIDYCLKPEKPGSIAMVQALSMAYADIGRYNQAIECEQKVLEVLKGHEPCHPDLLVEAIEMLKILKRKASFPNDIAKLKQVCFDANPKKIRKVFKNLLTEGFNKVELAMASWEFANEFNKQGRDPQKIVCLCKMSLKIFTQIMKNSSIRSNRKYVLVLGRILHLLGCAYHQLQIFPKSLKYLNIVIHYLTTSLKDDEGDDGSNVLADVHFELSRVKRAMSLIDDAGYNLRKGLGFGRGKCSDEIGMAIQQVGDDCMRAKNFTDALSFYLKAGQMYMKQVRPDQELLKEVRKSMALADAELETTRSR